jgi:hypothetical protein
MNNRHNHDEYEHGHHLIGELFCHLPYAIFSAAFGIVILSFITYFSLGIDTAMTCKGSRVLFHSFHFMHIAFAATGTLITFFRFSKNILKAIVVGIVSPSFFCSLSDVILPYLGGRMMGVPMKLHICFASELPNVLPFLFVGVINGFILSRHHHDRQGVYSVFSHAIHIFISSLASIFYLVSHGCTDWYHYIGIIFLFLIIAVVIPCTMSDVVVPMVFARAGKKS